jgi:hypothetical protein
MELNYDIQVFSYNGNNTFGERFDAAMAVLHDRYGAFPVLGCNALLLPSERPVLGVVFVSAQEERHFHQKHFSAALKNMAPRSVVGILHNSGRVALARAVADSHPDGPTALMALSHMTRESVQRNLGVLPNNTHVGWMLPTLSLEVGGPCAGPMAPCRTHFTIQGNMDGGRRNYGDVVDGVAALAPQLAAAGARLNIVGQGVPPVFPEAAAGLINCHANLSFSAYYDQLSASVALVPTLASAEYLDGTRITSTLVSSLITGVPVLATDEFMSVYTELPPACYYRQDGGESVAAAMLRVAGMSAEEHDGVRRCLRAARELLQGHNRLVLQQQLMRTA